MQVIQKVAPPKNSTLNQESFKKQLDDFAAFKQKMESAGVELKREKFTISLMGRISHKF